jgi:hypothetical protein
MYELDYPFLSPSALRFRNFKGCFEPDFLGQVIIFPKGRVAFFQVSSFRWGMMTLTPDAFLVRKLTVELEEGQEGLEHLADKPHKELDCWS